MPRCSVRLRAIQRDSTLHAKPYSRKASRTSAGCDASGDGSAGSSSGTVIGDTRWGGGSSGIAASS